MKNTIIYTVIFIIHSFGLVFGQLNHDELNRYIKNGQNQNLQLKQLESAYHAEFEAIKYRRALPNPKLNVGYFLESVETAAGPQEFKIGLSQPIPFFGKRALMGQIQQTKAETVYEQWIHLQLEIAHQIQSVWLDVYFLKKKITLTQQIYNLVQNWDHIVRAKYITSTSGHPDLIKSQIELIQLDETIQSLKDQLAPKIAQLKTLLNDTSLAEIRVPEQLNYNLLNLDKQALLTQIEIHNPILKQRESVVEKRNKETRLAKLNWMPDFSVGVEQIGTGEKEGSPFSGHDPIVAKLSIELPLWFGKNKSKIKSSSLKLESAQNMYKHETIQQESILETNWFQLTDSKRKIELYQNQLIPKAQEGLQVTEKAYRADRVDYLTLIDSQKRLYQFQLDYEQAVIHYFNAVSQLTILTGGKL